MHEHYPQPTRMLLLTVALPVYNGERTIERAIRSIQAQTWQGDMEILVYNDGSTDGTASIVDTLSKIDKRIILAGSEQNRGRPHARNELLRLGRGKYFAWLDADDEWYPLKLEEQFERLLEEQNLLQSDKVWCMCPCLIKGWDSAPFIFSPKTVQDPLKALLRGRLRAYLHTMLGPTESLRRLGGFDPQFPRLQDLDFFIRFVADGGQFVSTRHDEPLSVYNKSIKTSDCILLEISVINLWNKHQELFKKYGSRFARFQKAHLFHLPAVVSYKNGEYLSFIRYLARCFCISPLWTLRHYYRKYKKRFR